MKQGKPEAARAILQKSLKSLPKRKRKETTITSNTLFLNFNEFGVDFLCVDIKTISKFAQMEFKLGEAERGRTIFEGIMTTYPKRVDLWSIFLDMELRNITDPAVPRSDF